jgi:hypothetical protein
MSIRPPADRPQAESAVVREAYPGRVIPVTGFGGTGSVEFLLPGRWRRPLGGEGDSQVVDDLVYDSIVVDKGYYLHLGSAGRTGEWIDLINLPDPPTQMGSCPLSDALEGASADVT